MPDVGIHGETESCLADEGRESEFWSTREAADLLGVSLRTVQLWTEAGVLKAWKTAGGHRRISQNAVARLLRERAHALAPAPGTGRLRVLVVEDEPDFRKLYELHVGGWDLPVDLDTAANGFDALLHLGAVRPDLLITDLRMPGMDGFEMIRALRRDSNLRDLDILVVTALAAADVENRGGLPAGIEMLHKPLSFEHLRSRVAARIQARLRHAG